MAIGLAVLLASPVFFSDFFDDDVWHLGMLEGHASPARGVFDLYRFADGAPDEMRAAIARGGFFPWWGEPTMHAAFFRPLASGLTGLDHALFGHHALPYHVHVLLWFLACLGVVGLLHRRVLGGAVGGLATVLFAIDDGHTQTIGWIATRHAVIAALPCVLGLIAHLRWRQEGWKPGRILAPLAFAIGLTAGETALSAAAYVVAFELVGATGSRRERLGAIAPLTAVMVGYLALYRALGYGVRGSGSYVDPFSSPVAYALALPPRLAAYCGDLIAGMPIEVWLLAPGARMVLIAGGVFGVFALRLVIRKLAKTRPPPEVRAIAWLSLGALLSLLPGAAGFVGSRLLLVPSIGVFGVIAWVLVHGLRQLRGIARAVCGYLALAHVVVAPLVLFGGLMYLRRVAAESKTAALTADTGPPGSHVFVVGTADPIIAIYSPYWSWLTDARRPASWHCLSLAPFDHRLTRTADDTLELSVMGGRMLQSEFELVIRPKSKPFAAGAEVELDGSRIRVVEVIDGSPTRIALTTHGSLDDDQQRVLVWKNGGFERLVLPRVGETVRIPRSIGPAGL